MKQYIDKAAVVSEIEKLKERYGSCHTRNNYEAGLKEGRLIGYKDVLNKIYTLDVKEVQEETVSKELNMSARCFGFQNSEALFSFRLPAKAYLVGSEVKISIKQE